MSLDESGMNSEIKAGEVIITILPSHPLIKLAGAIDWDKLKEIILSDLKATTLKGKWWLGRKLKIRIHLAICILQQLYNKTDRQMECSLKDNAAFQLFCGKGVVKNWHCRDYTKIEEFRSRLSPAIQNALANEIAKLAVRLGYGKADCFDMDSTICEANMAYRV